MIKNMPPQLIVLSVIAEYRDGITIEDLISHIEMLKMKGIDLGYTFASKYGNKISKELLLDLNMLKLLGLIDEINGKYVVTEKGYNILSRLHVQNRMSY